MNETVCILYTNHRGETAYRRIIPRSIAFGTSPWHSEPQWLLKAFDVDKQAERDFAMLDIKEWLPANKE